MALDISVNDFRAADRLKVGVALKRGFFKNEGAKKYSTISAATMALAEAGAGWVDVVYLIPGQPRLPVQGLLLPGGDDVDPRHYGRPDLLGQVESADYDQDRFELELARWARRNELPVLGLCRGLQVLNVSRGGTLLPRLPLADQHFQQEAQDNDDLRPVPVHGLRVAAASKLWHVLQSDSVQVNSIHKGGVDELGEGLVATAWAEDGTVEALEAVGHEWAHAVLFHPEDLARRDTRWLRLFRSFLDACQATRELEAFSP